MIVTGPEIAKWAESKMVGFGFDNPMALGIIRDDKLMGAVVYDNYRPAAKSICVSIVICDKKALTRDLLKHLFNYPFNELGCIRMMAMIDVTNTPSMNLCRRLGFKHEGTLRLASPTGNDLAIFGMLKTECERWLNS